MPSHQNASSQDTMIDHLEQIIVHNSNSRSWLIEDLLLPDSVASSTQAPNAALGHRRLAALGIAFISLLEVEQWYGSGSATVPESAQDSEISILDFNRIVSKLGLEEAIRWSNVDAASSRPTDISLKTKQRTFRANVGAVCVDDGFDRAKAVLENKRK